MSTCRKSSLEVENGTKNNKFSTSVGKSGTIQFLSSWANFGLKTRRHELNSVEIIEKMLLYIIVKSMKD